MINIARYITPFDRELLDTQCSNCGKPLKIERYEAKIGRRVECSPECWRLTSWRVERERINQRARSQARYAARTGRIIKTACEVCGATPVEGHHTDYSKPLEVIWLCIPHHHAQHAVENIEWMFRCGVEFSVCPDELPTFEDYYREWKRIYDREVAARANKSKSVKRTRKAGVKKAAKKASKKGER